MPAILAAFPKSVVPAATVIRLKNYTHNLTLLLRSGWKKQRRGSARSPLPAILL